MKKIFFKISFFVFVIVAFYGCKSVMAKVYGIKNPEITSITEAQKYLSEKKILGKDVYFKSAKDFGLVTKGDIKLPDAIFYNKNGKQVEFRVTANECSNDITKFIENMNQINYLPQKEGILLNQLLNHISDSKGSVIQPSENADAVVFLNWSTYMGRLNKTVFEWTDILQKTSDGNDVKVEYYLLSFDFLDSWEDKHLIKQ